MNKLFLTAGLMALAASTASATESVGLLNDTGQIQCYLPNFSMVPCDEDGAGDSSAIPRQDARYGRDAAAAMGRLVKIGGGKDGFDFTRLCMNGDAEGEGDCPLEPPLPADPENPEPTDWACVRDNVTGLTWTLGNDVALATWAEASTLGDNGYIRRANKNSRCGLNVGWRLPTRREGFSIKYFGQVTPGVDADYFLPLANAGETQIGFWTTDVNVGFPLLNHVLDFKWASMSGGGQCREIVPDSICATPPPNTDGRWVGHVLLVNGEWNTVHWPEPEKSRGERWEIRDDGLVITDLATGLTWDRCSWGQSGPDCEGTSPVYLRWADAMQIPTIANQQRYKGHYDWRLPNARELESLVKIDAYEPSIDTNIFPNTVPNYYWTASTNWLAAPSTGNYAWCLNFQNAAVASQRKAPAGQPTPERSRVRLVRGGQQFSAFDGISEILFWADFESAPVQ